MRVVKCPRVCIICVESDQELNVYFGTLPQIVPVKEDK